MCLSLSSRFNRVMERPGTTSVSVQVGRGYAQMEKGPRVPEGRSVRMTRGPLIPFQTRHSGSTDGVGVVGRYRRVS